MVYRFFVRAIWRNVPKSASNGIIRMSYLVFIWYLRGNYVVILDFTPYHSETITRPLRTSLTRPSIPIEADCK